jgi:hypothetical protein
VSENDRDSADAEADAAAEVDAVDPARPARGRHRRVRLDGAPGADPAPQDAVAPVKAAEDSDRSWGDGGDSNDDRLKRDVPPHY